ncbi:MAG: purine-nucleoside phosphorylase [Fastidiosipila sp.]|nr:purine-nucleoside phosphorylase [Fastidiosipila sp.]
MRTSTPTPSNEALKGDYARVVLMPGDPLRAEYIAETYLDKPRLINKVRNMLAFTGKYQGRDISVMGSGMGVPSFSLYAAELFQFYGVEAIIRVGSAGGTMDHVKLRDIVIAVSASTDSSYARPMNFPGILAPSADYDLLSQAVDSAEKLGIKPHVGRVFTSDYFYSLYNIHEILRDTGHLCTEMETAGLYLTAQRYGKKALSLLTISDHLFTHEELTLEERQSTFDDMMKIALETAWHNA